jgi:error-prone DNA polymerase
MDALAHAGALARIAGDRRQARWRTMAADRIVDLLLDAPAAEEPAQLRAPSEVDDLIADYQAVGLTLGRHPLALLRNRLRASRVSCATDLATMRSGSTVRVAGLVTHR